MALFGWLIQISEQILSWMMNEFIHWPKPYLLMSATHDEILSSQTFDILYIYIYIILQPHTQWYKKFPSKANGRTKISRILSSREILSLTIPTPTINILKLDHIFIWLGPTPPTPPLLPAPMWEHCPVGDQCDNTRSLKPLSFFGMWRIFIS